MISEIRFVDGVIRSFEEPGAGDRSVPCFRCGVCCVRWQPLLSPEEQRQLARDIGVSLAVFKRRYTRPYPLRRGWRQLVTAEHGGCVFLTYEDGIATAGRRAGCSIHAVRPAVCRQWAPSLEKKECLEGLSVLSSAGVLSVDALYDNAEDKAGFIAGLFGRQTGGP